jgi:galactitol-specific phosphotransferase system IIB component
MKLKRLFTILAALFFALLISAQNSEKKISMTFSNIPLSEAISRIEKESNYSFFYDANKIDLNQKVSLKANNLSIKQLIAEMLKNTNINFEISNTQIVLYKKETEKPKIIPSQKISGVVTDKNNEPLIGATIKVQGTNIGTITDLNGKFTIEVPTGAQLTVSYVGYTPAVIEATGKNNLKIAL